MINWLVDIYFIGFKISFMIGIATMISDFAGTVKHKNVVFGKNYIAKSIVALILGSLMSWTSISKSLERLSLSFIILKGGKL